MDLKKMKIGETVVATDDDTFNKAHKLVDKHGLKITHANWGWILEVKKNW